MKKSRKKRRKQGDASEEIREARAEQRREPKDNSPPANQKVPDKPQAWQKVTKDRKPKKASRPKTRSDALLFTAKEGKSYTAILRKVKQEVGDSGDCSDKIRRTKTGALLIVLNKNSSGSAFCLQATIADVITDDAELVVSNVPEVEMEIKDLDEITMKEDIWEAIQKQDDVNCNISMSTIKSLRKAYVGTQRAIIRVTTDVASKLEKKGKIRIGVVNCRISATKRPIKCFKCWRYGHLATQCKSEVDRSNLCQMC
ncbi:uncharacterized protein LOC107046163 [Diachasma alloeum]|uniref:uncharacterized protein LOC107046163 n=1 Tax=Diachasma alloeum TaxID=454923 RepID=UPI0007384EBA|nr:uncharacterized protein LOC107046163 [Diachasma alloeum]